MRTLVKATIRIIVIFIFIKSLIALINYISNLVYAIQHIYSEDYDILLPLAIPVGSLLLGILVLYIIWWKTDWFVHVLIGDFTDNELVISTSNLDLMKVAMRILGIFLLVDSIPNFIGLIGYHYSFPEEIRQSIEIHANDIKEYIIVGLKFIFGIWLVVGTNSIMKTVDKIWDKAHLIEDHQEKKEE